MKIDCRRKNLEERTCRVKEEQETTEQLNRRRKEKTNETKSNLI